MHRLTQKLELLSNQIVPCESIVEEVLFEWSYHIFLSTDSKVRTTLQDSIIHSGSERVNTYPCEITFGIPRNSLEKNPMNS